MTPKIVKALRTISDGTMMLLCPPRARCLGCGSLLGTEKGWLCEACEKTLRPLNALDTARCARCGVPLDAHGRCRTCSKWPADSIRFARSAFLFGTPVRGLIHALKYDGVYRLADDLARWMHDTMIRECFDRPDALVAVPMYKKRLLKRGYNHALLLARALGQRTNLPVWEDCLIRTRNTPQQARLSGKKRGRSLEGAFAAKNVENASILLVDDVLTTGATATACARALLSAGAADVQLITLACTSGKSM